MSSDLSNFLVEIPQLGVKPRQSTTRLQYEYGCDGHGSNVPEDPDFGFVQEPTFVSLSSFTGRPLGGSQIQLEWITVVEFQNLGFNVYRSAFPDGEGTLLNRGLIPAHGGSFGGVYSLMDPNAARDGANFYWLEDIDWNMKTTRHLSLIHI